VSDHDLIALLLEKARKHPDFTKAELETAYMAVQSFREAQMDLACRRLGDPQYLEAIDGEDYKLEISFFCARLVKNIVRLRKNAPQTAV